MKKFIIPVIICILGIATYFLWNQNQSLTQSSTGATEKNVVNRVVSSTGQQKVIDEMTEVILSLEPGASAAQTKKNVKEAANKIITLAKLHKDKSYPGVKIMGMIAGIIEPLEGLVWRMRGVIEESDFMHAFVLNQLRYFSYLDYLYGPHINALFDYLTEPTTEGTLFASFSQLQTHLIESKHLRGKTKTIPEVLQEAIEALKVMQGAPATQFELEFDRTLITGKGHNGVKRFLDDDATKVRFIKPYVYTLTFLLERVLGGIYYFAVYNIDDLPSIVNNVITQTGFNSKTADFRNQIFGKTVVKGVTPKLYFEEAKKYEKTFMRPRFNEKDGQRYLDQAYEYMKSASKNQLKAYVCGIKYHMGSTDDCLSLSGVMNINDYESRHVSGGSKFMFNPNIMLVNFKQKFHELKRRSGVYDANGAATVVSDITGQSIRINVKALFKFKANWQFYFPTNYESSSSAGNTVTLANGEEQWRWNYKSGLPNSWNNGALTFDGMLPGVTSVKSLYENVAKMRYTPSIAPFAWFLPVPGPTAAARAAR